MGKFYVHKDGKVLWTGSCPDGDEEIQAPDAQHQVGLGEPPAEMMPRNERPKPTYDFLRSRAYPPVADQLDALWHAMDQGLLPKVPGFYEPVAAVKRKIPKR